MIYIVEVLERILILAASRLSMIALEKKTEWSGAWMDNRGGRHGKRGKRKLKSLQATSCSSITPCNRALHYCALQVSCRKTPSSILRKRW